MTAPDREDRSALHYAAMANRCTDTERSLAVGDDQNLRDDLGFTPLHLAAQEGSLETAHMLQGGMV